MIAKRVGRLANRLLLFAHFVGAAIEHDFAVVNPAFGLYAPHFPSVAEDLLCRFPAGASLPAPEPLRRAFCRTAEAAGDVLHALGARGVPVPLIRLRRDQHLDLDDPAFVDLVRRHRILLVQDWFFRSPADCARHRDAICAFLQPRPERLDRARRVVETARRGDPLLVGVHIRRADYSRFKDGRFFYSHEEYRGVLERVEAAFPADDVRFLVGSDESVPVAAFHGLDVAHGTGHEVEDLFALAGCDRLVGPPSTYTTWASYYGEVPRLAVRSAAMEVDPGGFRVERGLGWPSEDAETNPVALGPTRGAAAR